MEGNYSVNMTSNLGKRKHVTNETDLKAFSQDFKRKTEVLNPFMSSSKNCLDAILKLKDIYEKQYFITKEYLLLALARIVRTSSTMDLNVHETQIINDEIRYKAYKLVNEICETSSELFTFVNYDKQHGDNGKVSWGKGLRNMITEFYEMKPATKLARDVMNCKNACTFTHRDLIRQCHLHPSNKGQGHRLVLYYLVKDKKPFEISDFKENEDEDVKDILTFLQDIDRLNSSIGENKESIRATIEKHHLTLQQIPKSCQQFKEVYEGLLDHQPIKDLIQHIPKMAALNMLDEDSVHAQKVVERLNSKEDVKGLSPVLVMKMIYKYKINGGKKSSGAKEDENTKAKNKRRNWKKNSNIQEALKCAYKNSLQIIDKIDGKFLLALSFDTRKKHHVMGSNELKVIQGCAMMVEILLHAAPNLSVIFYSDGIKAIEVTTQMDTVTVIEKLNAATSNPKKDKKTTESEANLNKQRSNIVDCMEWASKSGESFKNILIICEHKEEQLNSSFKEAVTNYRAVANAESKIAAVGLVGKTKLPNKEDFQYLDITGLNEVVWDLLHKFFSN